jgi:NAD(P)H dehydrogenase (quinone)
MKVLVVRAHHEPQSFSNALAHQAARTLMELGHQVDVSDLYEDGFNPVSDRRNFTRSKNPDYLKQQLEEVYATETNSFAPDLEAEIRKLESADLLIFSFPMWWFGLPAILKGWVDRVFAFGRIYGGGKVYENGLGQARKRGLILMTTGGGPDAYGGFGINPPVTTVLAPIQHGIFWFNGFLPLQPFIAWAPAHLSQDQRVAYLTQLDLRLRSIDTEKPLVLPPQSDFPDWGKETKKRFMVTASHAKTPDNHYQALVPEEIKQIAELKRQGVLLSSYIGSPSISPWMLFCSSAKIPSTRFVSISRRCPLPPI